MILRETRIAICCLVLFLGMTAVSSAATGIATPDTKAHVHRAPLKFLNASDLPKLQQLQTLPFSLMVRNDGSLPIHFQRFATICDCIRVIKYPPVLAAGDTGKIELTCTGHEEIGIFNNRLTAWYAQGNLTGVMHESTPLVMHTIPLRDIQVSPRRYDFGWKPPCAIERVQIVFFNHGSQTYKIRSVTCNRSFHAIFDNSVKSHLLKPGSAIQVVLLPRVFADPGKYHFKVVLRLVDVEHPNIQQEVRATIVGHIAAPPVLRTRNLQGTCSLQGSVPEIVVNVPADKVLRISAPSPLEVYKIIPSGHHAVIKFKLSRPVEDDHHVVGRICVYTSEAKFPVFAVAVDTTIRSTISGVMGEVKNAERISLYGFDGAKTGIRLWTVRGNPVHFASSRGNGGIVLSTKRRYSLLIATVPVRFGLQKLLLLAPPSGEDP